MNDGLCNHFDGEYGSANATQELMIRNEHIIDFEKENARRDVNQSLHNSEDHRRKMTPFICLALIIVDALSLLRARSWLLILGKTSLPISSLNSSNGFDMFSITALVLLHERQLTSESMIHPTTFGVE